MTVNVAAFEEAPKEPEAEAKGEGPPQASRQRRSQLTPGDASAR